MHRYYIFDMKLNDTEQNETETSDMGTKRFVSISMDQKKLEANVITPHTEKRCFVFL